MILLDGTELVFGEVDLGTQPTSRHLYYTLPVDVPLAPAMVRLTLSNDAGEAGIEVSWPPGRTAPNFINCGRAVDVDDRGPSR